MNKISINPRTELLDYWEKETKCGSSYLQVPINFQINLLSAVDKSWFFYKIILRYLKYPGSGTWSNRLSRVIIDCADEINPPSPTRKWEHVANALYCLSSLEVLSSSLVFGTQYLISQIESLLKEKSGKFDDHHFLKDDQISNQFTGREPTKKGIRKYSKNKLVSDLHDTYIIYKSSLDPNSEIFHFLEDLDA
jgi:hypothetical protein